MLDALRGQTLDKSKWELVVVDNASSQDLERELGPGLARMGWATASQSEMGNARVVREDRLGLTHARVRGFEETKGEIVVMVDDDNLLRPDYLEKAVEILDGNPFLGAIGGKAQPEYETEPPEWLKDIRSGLGLRDLGGSIILYPDSNKQDGVKGGRWKVEGGPSFATNFAGSGGASEGLKTGRVRRKMTEFPDCAPIGAGMVIRREAAMEYVNDLVGRSRVVTDRRGKSLSSGGDNDICLTVLENGWQVGYFPELELTHLIPKERMTVEYQRRMARDAMRSYIVMLDQHGIRPWPAMARWTLPVKVVRSWWRTKPWSGIRARLSFENTMGQFLGRSDIGGNP